MIAPVSYNRQGANPCWEPFTVGAQRDLAKTVKEFGEDSPHFKMVLNTVLNENILVPEDLKKNIWWAFDGPKVPDLGTFVDGSTKTTPGHI